MTTKSPGPIASKAVAAAMLLLALAPLPYGYYTFLRWLVCAVAVFNAFTAFQLNKTGWAFTLTVIALIFNPFIPVHLGREMWALVDLTVAAAFIASIFKVDCNSDSA